MLQMHIDRRTREPRHGGNQRSLTGARGLSETGRRDRTFRWQRNDVLWRLLRRHCARKGEMPDHGCKAFGLPQGASYAEGAASVLTGRQMWSDHFGMVFRAR
jgi:hypothetical protein